MRGIVAAILVAAMLAVPFALAGNASAATNTTTSSRDLTPTILGPVSTDRFGGGDLIAIKAGDAKFGVRYGTSSNPNDVMIFAEYTRFLGAADIVDEQGRQLGTRGIPVHTVMGQSLNRFIEFQTWNVTNGFDLFSANGTSTEMPVNVPVKALRLDTAWTMSGLTYELVGSTYYVNFTVSASDLHYTWVNLHFPDANGTGDNVLNNVSFTFHLQVDVVDRSGQVPWYKVTVSDGTPREVTNVTFEGTKAVSGRAVQMGAKYDHSIQGWDFANRTDKLALETRLVFGNHYPDRTVDFIHMAYYHDHADDGTHSLGDEQALNTTAPTAPHLYTRDRIYFDDNWTRVGRFEWVSTVTVDGVQEKMLFEVQGGGRLLADHDGAVFRGFWLHGAFVYPAGQSIVHDPAMSAEAFLPNLTTGFNLTPLGILLIQIAVVGVAIIPALYLRSKARRQK